MFTLSSSLASPPSRAHAFPGEFLTLIYNQVDNPATLSALCLVSFDVWKIARPLLYERVEVRSIKTLLLLLFNETPSASARLPPLHQHILGTLVLDVPLPGSYGLLFTFEDFIAQSGFSPANYPAAPLLPFALPISVTTLILPHCSAYRAFGLYYDTVFHRISPLHVLFEPDPLEPPKQWLSWITTRVATTEDPLSLRRWTRLTRITMRGRSWTVSTADVPPWDAEDDRPISNVWLRQHAGRSLELVFDFTKGDGTGYRRLVNAEYEPNDAFESHLEEVLFVGGAGNARLYEGDVMIRLAAADEEEARRDIAQLPWTLRDIVRVEFV